ncbi:phage baseplate assembly protein V [Enterobacter ludwigii]
MNDITLKISGQICSLNISWLRIQQQINEIPTARLELLLPTDSKGSRDREAKNSAARLITGSDVTILLKGRTLFRGSLTSKRIALHAKTWSIHLEARHLLQKLAFFPHSRIFRQQDEATILNSLLWRAGVKITYKATTQLSIRHDQMVQFRVTDWLFMLNRLFASNCWLVPDAGSNYVTVAPLSEPTVVSHRLENDAPRNGYTLYDMDLTFDNRFTPDSLSLQGWEITRQQLSVEQKSHAMEFRPWKTTELTASLEKRDYQLAFSTMPEPSLEPLARSWLNHLQLTGVHGRILLDGTLDFKLGESISLNEFGAGLDGTAILTGTNQQFDPDNGWRTELLIGMTDFISQSIPSEQSLHIATVVEFTPDPQGLGRIAISLPALNLPGEHIFARLGKPWASKSSGFCFYPEPGDEVIIGFIENDPRYPVIIDSVHNPKNMAPIVLDKENNLKGLVVNDGDHIEQLLFNTKDNSFTLSADTLSLTGENKLEITSASINMKKK